MQLAFAHAKRRRDCDFPALPTKARLLYTLCSPLFAQDDAFILADIFLSRQLEHPPMIKSPLSGLALVATILLSVVSAPQTAHAQGLIEFLWGGGDEWGGGRQNVAFSSQYKPGQVIVSFGDRRLYLVTQTGQALSYPIAVPREKSRWQGTTFVSEKRINPAWTPTAEMRRENPRLPNWVPGGHPMNPLGNRALYLGSSAYRIHGTDAPWTIGQAVSKGCVRMHNADVLDLYPRVPVGTRVTVTWQRFSSAPVAASSGSGATDPQAEPKRKYYRPASGPRNYQIPARKPAMQKAAQVQ
jgi:L,D-transpeptidase catalytic domain